MTTLNMRIVAHLKNLTTKTGNNTYENIVLGIEGKMAAPMITFMMNDPMNGAKSKYFWLRNILQQNEEQFEADELPEPQQYLNYQKYVQKSKKADKTLLTDLHKLYDKLIETCIEDEITFEGSLRRGTYTNSAGQKIQTSDYVPYVQDELQTSTEDSLEFEETSLTNEDENTEESA